MPSATDRSLELKLREALDNPEALAQVLQYALQRNPAVALKVLGEFGTLNAVREVVRGNPGKVRQWTAEALGTDAVLNVGRQFVTAMRGQADVFASAATAAALESIAEVRKLVGAVADEAVKAELERACAIAADGFRADLAEAVANFNGQAKVAAHNVLDTATCAIENVALRGELR